MIYNTVQKSEAHVKKHYKAKMPPKKKKKKKEKEIHFCIHQKKFHTFSLDCTFPSQRRLQRLLPSIIQPVKITPG